MTQTEDGYTSTNDYLAQSKAKYAKSVDNPLNYSFIFVLAMMAGTFASVMLRGDLDVSERTQPFLSHAPALTLKHERGTGLGLYICSRLAALLGGKLSIECTLGKGTRVTVSMLCRLPADLVIKDEVTDDEPGIQKVTGPGLPVHSD